MARWKVTSPEGVTYSGVEANSAEEAMAKMQGGAPAVGPLTAPPASSPTSPMPSPMASQVPGTTVPSSLGQMRQDMLAHGLSEADVRQGQNAMANVPGAQVVLKPGMQQQGPLAPPAMPTLAERPGTEKARVVSGMQDILQKAGRTPEEAQAEAERVGSKLPGSWREIAGMAVPPVIAALIPGGRTVTRIGGNIVGNILGRGAVEAGAEALTAKPGEQDIFGAAAQGAMKGVLPGVIQGGIGAAIGPNKATIQTQRAIEAVKSAVSPEVAAKLDTSEPANFFSRMTTKAMKRAAGDNLDMMEADIGSALKGQKFSVFTTPGRPNPTFDEVRARIKDLRDVGDLAFTQDPVARKTARDSLAQASILERDMLAQMPKDLAAQYMQAMKQHAVDMDAVRFVRGQQARQQISGGVNPFDNPELGKAERALSPLTGSQVLHGAVGAAEAATGRGLGAMYHLGQAVKGAKQKYAGKVAETAPSGPLAQRLSVPNLIGMLGGAGTSAGQSYLAGSTEE